MRQHGYHAFLPLPTTHLRRNTRIVVALAVDGALERGKRDALGPLRAVGLLRHLERACLDHFGERLRLLLHVFLVQQN